MYTSSSAAGAFDARSFCHRHSVSAILSRRRRRSGAFFSSKIANAKVENAFVIQCTVTHGLKIIRPILAVYADTVVRTD